MKKRNPLRSFLSWCLVLLFCINTLVVSAEPLVTTVEVPDLVTTGETTYSITIKDSDEGGSLSLDKVDYTEGEEVSIKYSPENGYKLYGVEIYDTDSDELLVYAEDSMQMLEVTEDSINFEMVDMNLTVKGIFVKDDSSKETTESNTDDSSKETTDSNTNDSKGDADFAELSDSESFTQEELDAWKKIWEESLYDPTKEARFNGNTGSKTFTEVLGITDKKWLDTINKYSTGSYYLGTPYPTLWEIQTYKGGIADFRSPNGNNWQNLGCGPRLQCTGFIWHLLWNAGANPSSIPNLRVYTPNSYPGGWTQWMTDKSVERVSFSSKSAMLASGQLEKGDIIWSFDGNWDQSSDYHHIMIYMGDGKSDLCWDSCAGGGVPSGNAIHQLHAKGNNTTAWVVVKRGRGWVRFYKRSTDESITKGNNAYSLAKAAFAVYSDANGSSLIAKMVTDSNGYTKYVYDKSGKLLRSDGWLELPPGTYYYREIEPPTGYNIITSDTAHIQTGDYNNKPKAITVTKWTSTSVSADATWTINEDYGTADLGAFIRKVDSDTNEGIEGAQFKVSYYKNVYNGSIPDGVSPLRTWVFKSNKDGEVRYEESFRVSGDALYKNLRGGYYALPFGTVTIQEISAPEGYIMDDTVYVKTITPVKDTAAPSARSSYTMPSELKGTDLVSFRTWSTIQGPASGWTSFSGNEDTSGNATLTSSAGGINHWNRLVCLQVKTTDPDLYLKYSAYSSKKQTNSSSGFDSANYGWGPDIYSNATEHTYAGSAGSIHAIRMTVEGSKAKDYNVFYRLYLGRLGWTGWASNGDTSGFTGQDWQGEYRAAQSVQIMVLPKTEKAPINYIAPCIRSSDWVAVYTTTVIGNTSDVLKTDLTINKLGPVDEVIQDAEFGLYSDEACSKEVANGKTDSKGKLSFDKLEDGTYYLKELSVPSPYILDNSVHTITLQKGDDDITHFTYDGKDYTSATSGDYTIKTENKKSLGNVNIHNKSYYELLKLKVVKYTKVGKTPIEGVEFTHTYTKADGTEGKEVVTTDKDGAIYLDKKTLLVGNHTIKETKAPAQYKINPGVVTFKVTSDAKIQLVSNTATEATGAITFTVTANGLSAEMTVEDEYNVFDLNIVKKNDKDKLLSNAEFTLYEDAACTKVVATKTSDNDGKLAFTDLILAKNYYLKETKAPQGYAKPSKVYTISASCSATQFELSVDGKIIQTKTLTNSKMSGEMTVINEIGKKLPKTGTRTLFVMTILGLSLMVVAIWRRKSKKN